MGNWKEHSLLELFDVTNGLTKGSAYFGSGSPFLTFKEIFKDCFLPEELTNLANSSEKEQIKCSIKKGDVFITRTSETFDELGITSVALKDYPNATFNGFTKRLRPKSVAVEISPQYLAFYFRSSYFRRQVLSLTTMTTRASLNNEMLARLTLLLPDIDTQIAIAGVLFHLHRKIRANQQINQTLEMMAQAVFKSWFVDFEPTRAKMAVVEAGGTEEDANLAAMTAISGKSSEDLAKLKTTNAEAYAQLHATASLFPSRLVESELGEIPEGWNLSEIGNEIEAVGGGTPSTKEAEFWENGTFHWTTPKDMSDLKDKVLIDTERKITEAGLRKISSGLLPIDTVLMSSRAPVGYLAIAKIPVAINQGYIAMKCNKQLTPEFVIQWCVHNMEEIKQRASGTTFAEISKKSFYPIPVVVPTAPILQSYTKSARNFYSQIESLARENQNLAITRDSLLPKLLSGEISVENQLGSEG
jgi:type I restriction enzyme S subunit